MVWNIVTDSSCDLGNFILSEEDFEIRHTTVPFIIGVDSQEYVDDAELKVEDMLDHMERSRQASSTSCPSPASWEDAFRTEGNVIAITISKELSGSYNSACIARDMVLEAEADKKIAIINSTSAGAGLVLVLRMLCAYIKAGNSFDKCVEYIENIVKLKRTIFALSSFDNLVKNGRMSKVAGFVAKKLNFWGIGVATLEGKIEIKDKVRGSKKAIKAIVEDVLGFNTPIQHIVISNCQNKEMAEMLKEEIGLHFLEKNVEIEIHETKGLCSYYAERHGLIVAYI